MSDVIPPADININNILTSDLLFLLVNVGNSTLSTQNSTLQNWTTTNSLLTTTQVSDPIATVATTNSDGDPTSYSYIVDGVAYTPVPGDTCKDFPEGSTEYLRWQLVQGMNAALSDPSNLAGGFKTFMDNFEVNPKYVTVMSEAFGSVVLGLQNYCWDSSDTSTSSASLATINNIDAQVTATAQQEESIGQAAAKNLTSLIQNQSGNNNSLAEIGKEVLGISSSITSALAQGIV